MRKVLTIAARERQSCSKVEFLVGSVFLARVQGVVDLAAICPNSADKAEVSGSSPLRPTLLAGDLLSRWLIAVHWDPRHFRTFAFAGSVHVWPFGSGRRFPASDVGPVPAHVLALPALRGAE
jgi:hypothetical protein